MFFKMFSKIFINIPEKKKIYIFIYTVNFKLTSFIKKIKINLVG